jgi:hypothetical protein
MIRPTADLSRARSAATAASDAAPANAANSAQAAATTLADLYATLRSAAAGGRFTAIGELATTLASVPARMPSQGDVKQYSEDLKAALDDVKDAGLLYLTHPRAGLQSIVTTVRRLFETLDLASIANGLDEAALVAGEQVPAALDSFATTLAEIDSAFPPGVDSGLGPTRARLDNVRAVFGGEVKELSAKMQSLGERLRELDEAGRSTNDPDDLARIVAETEKVASELFETSGQLRDTIELVRPELTALKDDLAASPLANDPRVATMIANLERLDGTFGKIAETIETTRPMLGTAVIYIRYAAPYVQPVIDLAQNHARAAGTLMDRVMYGVGMWQEGRYGRAVGEWIGASSLLPLSLASWGIGAAGIGTQVLARWLMKEHPALFPLAWPLLQVGKGLDAVAGGIAWVNDKVMGPVAGFLGGAAGVVGEGIQKGIEAGAKVADEVGKAAKKVADDIGKAAKKVWDSIF